MSFGFSSLSSPSVSNEPYSSSRAPMQVSTNGQLRKSELKKLRTAFIETHGLADLYKSNVSEETASVLQQRLYHLTNIRTEQSSTLKAFKRTIPPIVHPLTIFEEIVPEITNWLETESNSVQPGDEKVARYLLFRAELHVYLSKEDLALADYKEVEKRFPVAKKSAESGIQTCKRRLGLQK